MDFETWWCEQDTRFKHSNLRDEIYDVWIAATKTEREACAVVCEQQLRLIAECPEMAAYCADAIRMRSNKK